MPEPLFTEETIWKATTTALAATVRVINREVLPKADERGYWPVIAQHLQLALTACANLGRKQWPEAFKQLEKKYNLSRLPVLPLDK